MTRRSVILALIAAVLPGCGRKGPVVRPQPDAEPEPDTEDR